MSFLLKRVLAIFLIAGLGVSPLYAATMKGMEPSAQASSMAGMADDMPCHPAKLPSDKSSSDKSSSDKSSPDQACPFMVACLSLCFQGMPPVFGAIAIPATLELRTPFERVRQLTSLAPSPPARPPRA
jgi:hypothetical protein